MISDQNNKPKAEGHWYLVIAHAGRERLARYHLAQQGYEVYLPMRAPLTGNRKAQPRPFLPRYLFVRVDLARPGWRSIYSTIGVRGILTTGAGEMARPKAISVELVDGIKEREVDGLVILAPKVEEAACPHKRGDKVHIPIGNRFGDLEAIFEERVDAQRAAILISLLGRDSRQIVPLASLA
jgi:transcriptional antiterminator RfaH